MYISGLWFFEKNAISRTLIGMSNMRRREDHKSSSSGFTLVELLVVISIIAVLASMLLNGLARSKALAQSLKCRSNLRQLILTTHLYLTDHSYYPGYRAVTAGSGSGKWESALDAYLRQPQKTEYFGPEHAAIAVLMGKPFMSLQGVFACPSYRGIPYTSSYGYNTGGAPHRNLIAGDPLGLGCKGPHVPFIAREYHESQVKEADVLVPSEMLAFGDNVYGKTQVHRRGHREVVLYDDFDFISRLSTKEGGSRIRTREVQKRHLGKLNYAFVDGHIESMKIDRIFLDSSDEVLRLWNRDHEPHRDRYFGEP